MKRNFKTVEQIEKQLNELEKERIDEKTLKQYAVENEISRRASFYMPIFVACVFTAAVLLINHFHG